MPEKPPKIRNIIPPLRWSVPNKDRHLRILLKGVDAWNDWRKKHPDIRPYLVTKDEELSGVDLRQIDLSDCDLTGASFDQSDLRSANLRGSSLFSVSLVGANLRKAVLTDASLRKSDLTGASLREAHLGRADLTDSALWEADFRGANLIKANFTDAGLIDANFTNTEMCDTIFGANDLSSVIGLESVRHTGPSVISIETVFFSKGNIPEVFLRGVGVPENVVTYMSSLVGKAIEFYSCFISYSRKNQPFVSRLHADLQSKGVRCWLASEDLKIGDKTRPSLDESIRRHEKLLLVLSKHSVTSDWVEQEVETALARERRERRSILFPIRLDNTVMSIDTGWPAYVRNTRHIGDFTKWKHFASYRKAFARLIRDLSSVAEPTLSK